MNKTVKKLIVIITLLTFTLTVSPALADSLYSKVISIKKRLEKIYYEGLGTMQSGSWTGKDANRYEEIVEKMEQEVEKWQKRYKNDIDKIEEVSYALLWYRINVIVDMATASPTLIQNQNEVFDRIDSVLEELESESRGD